ncbi:SHIRT domain-containing protein, partial [uncultured Anaerococcus sp.]|uniref:SHIRT domain-containing protein n=1 Tax=uncultured Anaerococcus sp. TaxID=293428 RepID=UPI002804AC99
MEFDVPKNDSEIYSIYNEEFSKYYDGSSLKPVVTGDNANKGRNENYSGAFGDDNILLGNAADPSIEFGYGEIRRKNNTGYTNVNNKKYLLNVFGDHLTIKRFAVYEALKVKFNTGEGKLEGGEKNADIGQPQEIGYSEKIDNNESGRKVTIPNGTIKPPKTKVGDKDVEAKFAGWSTEKQTLTNGVLSNVDDSKLLVNANGSLTKAGKDYTFTKDETPLYAVFEAAKQGKVKIKYVNESNGDLLKADPSVKIDNEGYPEDKTGIEGQVIDAALTSTSIAPKFIGYKIKSVKLQKGDQDTTDSIKYTKNGDYTVVFVYEELDDIIPGKGDDGQANPKATDDVKNTYIPVTWKLDSEKGKFKKGEAAVAGTEFSYYVNPTKKKTFSDVVEKSGLTPASKDENTYKIDTENPSTFNPEKVKATNKEQKPSLVVENGTEINKLHFTVENGLVVTVNFKQTKADQLKNKLAPETIKVWVGDNIDWKKGVKLKDANEGLQKILDEDTTIVTDESNRKSSKQNLPEGTEGTLKVTFSDGSSLKVVKQMLYVADQKVEEKDPKDKDYINPDLLPKDKVKVEIKLGEGVKEVKKDGKVGDKTNPVVIKTFYIKPNTGLAVADFPRTSGDNAEIVKQANYKNQISWNISDLTKAWDNDGAYVASAKLAVCKNPKVLQKEFEEAIDPMFENIKKKDGVYLGEYDKANKKVTVAIIDKTKQFSELKGTGLVAGIKDLLKDHNLIKYQVGNQPARDLKAIDKASGTEQALVNNLAQIVGSDIGNEINGQGSNINTLADFIDKKITLKLTVQEPDCENNPVELTYTIEGKEAISSILKGKLSPQDIKVWKGDKIDWEMGVKKNENGLTPKQIEQIKDEFSTVEGGKKKVGKAKFEDATTPARNSEAVSANAFVGKIKVKFSDGSELLVEKQNLYVSEHMTGGKNANAPEDAIKVQFLLGNGVKAKKGETEFIGAETPVVYETYKVKPNLDLDKYKTGTGNNIFGNINPQVTDASKFSNVVWNPTNHIVTEKNKEFTATATESFIMKHTFKLLDKDNKNAEITTLPKVLTDILPKDGKVSKDETYTPENLDPIKNVKEGDNFYDYTFINWDPTSAKNADKTFTGTWTKEQSTSEKPIIDQPTEGDDK